MPATITTPTVNGIPYLPCQIRPVCGYSAVWAMIGTRTAPAIAASSASRARGNAPTNAGTTSTPTMSSVAQSTPVGSGVSSQPRTPTCCGHQASEFRKVLRKPSARPPNSVVPVVTSDVCAIRFHSRQPAVTTATLPAATRTARRRSRMATVRRPAAMKNTTPSTASQRNDAGRETTIALSPTPAVSAK